MRAKHSSRDATKKKRRTGAQAARGARPRDSIAKERTRETYTELLGHLSLVRHAYQLKLDSLEADFAIPPSAQVIDKALSAQAEIARLAGLTHILSKPAVEASNKFLQSINIDRGLGEDLEFYISVTKDCIRVIRAEAEAL